MLKFTNLTRSPSVSFAASIKTKDYNVLYYSFSMVIIQVSDNDLEALYVEANCYHAGFTLVWVKSMIGNNGRNWEGLPAETGVQCGARRDRFVLGGGEAESLVEGEGRRCTRRFASFLRGQFPVLATDKSIWNAEVWLLRAACGERQENLISSLSLRERWTCPLRDDGQPSRMQSSGVVQIVWALELEAHVMDVSCA
ncbi:hypothetical protein Tco_1502677 [Tanacetum coccineum]